MKLRVNTSLPLLLGVIIVIQGIAEAQPLETWGDVPPEQLAELSVQDFIDNTSKEKDTLAVLELLGLSPTQSLRAVIYNRTQNSDLSTSEEEVQLVTTGGWSFLLSARSRAIVTYDGFELYEKTKSHASSPSDRRITREEIEVVAVQLGRAAGLNVDSVRIDSEFDGGVWNVDVFQIFEGYLCPLNVYTVLIEPLTKSVLMLSLRPFITKAHTKLVVNKKSATQKAFSTAAKRTEYEGLEVKGQIPVEKPYIYPAGIEKDAHGNVIGLTGRLAWPVYIDGSSLIIYIDCETGEVLRSLE